jgi:hypothetical protein
VTDASGSTSKISGFDDALHALNDVNGVDETAMQSPNQHYPFNAAPGVACMRIALNGSYSKTAVEDPIGADSQDNSPLTY